MRSVHGSHRGWTALNSKRKPKKPVKKYHCYEVRENKLQELGYSNYQQYLNSDDWKRIRERKLRKYCRCLLCDNRASQVHHMSYDYFTLLGIEAYRLVQLCDNHHTLIEIEADTGRKRTLEEANRVLFELAKACVRGQKWMIWLEDQERICRQARKKRRKAQISSLSKSDNKQQ